MPFIMAAGHKLGMGVGVPSLLSRKAGLVNTACWLALNRKAGIYLVSCTLLAIVELSSRLCVGHRECGEWSTLPCKSPPAADKRSGVAVPAPFLSCQSSACPGSLCQHQLTSIRQSLYCLGLLCQHPSLRSPRPQCDQSVVMSDVPTNRFLVQIMSVGYRHFMQDQDFTQDDLEQRIGNMIRRQSQCPYLILGVLHFTDPGRDHIGKHSETLRSVTTAMLGKGAPAQLAAALRQKMQEAVGARQETVHIVVWCRSGKQRSVAAAEVFGHVISKISGVRTEITHMSQPEWGQSRDSCAGRCADCRKSIMEQRPFLPVLQRFLGSFATTWRAAGPPDMATHIGHMPPDPSTALGAAFAGPLPAAGPAAGGPFGRADRSRTPQPPAMLQLWRLLKMLQPPRQQQQLPTSQGPPHLQHQRVETTPSQRQHRQPVGHLVVGPSHRATWVLQGLLPMSA